MITLKHQTLIAQMNRYSLCIINTSLYRHIRVYKNIYKRNSMQYWTSLMLISNKIVIIAHINYVLSVTKIFPVKNNKRHVFKK